MKSIKVKESREVERVEEEVEYTYEEIRELFPDNEGSLVNRLLNRVEELELRIELGKVGDNEKLAEEVVSLRARNEELRRVIDQFKDVISNIGKPKNWIMGPK